MQRFRKILVALGGKPGKPSAIERAVSLATATGARLSVVMNIEDMPPEIRCLGHHANLEKLEVERAESVLAHFAGLIRKKGLDVSSILLHGNAAMEIIREVLRNEHDLVIKDAEGKGAITEALFGSTDLQLMRKCPVPLWVLKPTENRPYRRVAAAVDAVRTEEREIAYNRKIIDVACAIARYERAELHLFHAWSVYGEGLLRGRRSSLSRDQIASLSRETRAIHQQALEQLVGRCAPDLPQKHIQLRKGEPGHIIPVLARRARIDIVVMGTVSRTGIAGFLIGNTAESVLRKVNCSVMVVKPDGFTTPVQLDA